jgi:hypothetical protein
VQVHITGCPSGWQEIKIANLLTHTSGISLSGLHNTSMLPTAVPQVLARYQNKPLEFKPGERLKYSNVGYDLLGAWLKKSHTGCMQIASRSGFSNRLGCMTPATRRLGTVFIRLLETFTCGPGAVRRKTGSKEFLAEMFVPYRDGFGFGWKTLKEFQHRVLTNPAGAAGLSSVIRRYPDDDVCIIVLSDMENVNSEKISFDLGAIVFDVNTGQPR